MWNCLDQLLLPYKFLWQGHVKKYVFIFANCEFLNQGMRCKTTLSKCWTEFHRDLLNLSCLKGMYMTQAIYCLCKQITQRFYLRRWYPDLSPMVYVMMHYESLFGDLMTTVFIYTKCQRCHLWNIPIRVSKYQRVIDNKSSIFLVWTFY